jgi:fibronectin-binding autotransporter adhesin
MKRRNYIAFLSAAVAAVVVGGNQKASADILQWDASGNSAPSYTDGPGIWDTSTVEWVDQTTSTDVAWSNTSPANSAVFGNPSPTAAINGNTAYEVDLASAITVQDITLGTGSNGTPYGIITDLGGSGASLTVNGNITKETSGGNLQFDMYSSNLTLGPGNHTIAANDTSGDAAPELGFYASLTGSGNVIVDNGSFAEWGTTAFVYANSYTGSTYINKGRLEIGDENSLNSSSGTTIANQGTLSIGGDIGPLPTNENTNFNITEPITITRNTYTGTDYSDFPDAIISANTGQNNTVVTLANLTIDSTDARIAADTSTISIPNSLVAGPDVAAGTAVADFDGDYAGAVILSGDNTAFGAAGDAIEIINGVELTAANDAALGGAGSKLILTGGELHITSALLASNPAFATNFGGHVIVNGTVGTGVDVDQGLTFTVNGLTGAGVGMRGGGTLDFEGTNTFTGTPYYDGVDDGPNEGTETDTTATGIVNFMAGSTTTQVGLRVRSATLNVAGTLNVGGTYTSIGADSTGSNGTPDYGTVNITSGGSVIENSGDDFNVSDNNNTKGTINLSGTGDLTVGGTLYIGKSSGATGTINMSGTSTLNANSLVFVGENNGTGVFNQSGGSINLTRTGNFTFVVSDGRNGSGSGQYNLSGGSFTSAGEVYVGEGVHGSGTWNQTGGTVLDKNWFVVGRENATGTVNISGGTFTRSDGGALGDDPGNQTSIGDSPSNSGLTDTFNISGTAQVNINTGEFWLGNGGGNAILNMGTPAGALTGADSTASLTVNNWFAIGRGGNGSGTVNLYDGTITQATANWFDISGDGGSANGTVNVYGGTLNVYQMYLGENGSGNALLNINGGSVNAPNNTVFANGNSVNGTINLNGGTFTAFGFTAQNGGGTGKGTFFFNGGVLKASANNTNFIGAKVTSVVSTGGAIINTNGHAVTLNSTLTHDSTLSGADGGLTKQGTGTLTLTASETYTGPTTISAGTLQYTGNNNETLSSLSIANGAALDLSGGQTVTITAGLSGYLADIQAAYDHGAWDGTSATSPIITSAFAATNRAVGIGYATSGSALTLRLTYLGDADLSGAVTNSDILAMVPTSSGGTWATGDFNYDGAVNADDFSLAQLGAVASNGANITALVPEPASLALLALPAILGFAPRRTRKRSN